MQGDKQLARRGGGGGGGGHTQQAEKPGVERCQIPCFSKYSCVWVPNTALQEF